MYQIGIGIYIGLYRLYRYMFLKLSQHTKIQMWGVLLLKTEDVRMQDHLTVKDNDTFVLFCATYGLLWINRAERLAWGKVGKPRGDRTHELRSAGAGDAWGVSASPPDCMLAEYNLRTASPYAMWHHFSGGFSKPTDTSNWTMNHGQRINTVHHQQVFFCHFSSNPRRLSTTRMPGFGSCPLPFVHVCNSVSFNMFLSQRGILREKMIKCNRFTTESCSTASQRRWLRLVRTCHSGSSCVNIDPGAVGWWDTPLGETER